MDQSIEKLLYELAKENNTIPDDIYQEIEVAISFAYESPDPESRLFWERIPHEGERPTPEDVIIAITNQLLGLQ